MHKIDFKVNIIKLKTYANSCKLLFSFGQLLDILFVLKELRGEIRIANC